jgi:hypothetical protein
MVAPARARDDDVASHEASGEIAQPASVSDRPAFVTRIYDRLAKEALSQALSSVSRELVAERELAPDAQRLDLWCVPDPAKVPSLAPLGISGTHRA